jgi:putative peptide zinc metalloprotease protein
MTPAGATLQSRICLQELASRPDGRDWIVGRVATGEFVSVPTEAMTFIGVLRRGGTVADAKRYAEAAHGDDIDALDFVASLVELGFVAAVDGERVAQEPPRPPSLPRLRPRHVSWLFCAPALLLVGAFICAGVTAAAISGSFPGYAAFFALGEPGLNLVLVTAITMAIVALHEFCHLAAARAADVHGWFGWSTRLFFLVAQTSVPGLWMADRRVRLRVYLAGMASDLTVFSACLIGVASTPPASPVHRILALACLICLLGVADQFAFYMRTDVYLVVQELTGCKNLFADATEYLRYLAVGRRAGQPNPVSELPDRERRPVRIYAAVVVAGVAVTVPVFAFYILPVEISIITRSVHELANGLAQAQLIPAADAAGALIVTLVFEAILVRALLRTYLPHLRRLLQRPGRPPTVPVGEPPVEQQGHGVQRGNHAEADAGPYGRPVGARLSRALRAVWQSRLPSLADGGPTVCFSLSHKRRAFDWLRLVCGIMAYAAEFRLSAA